METRDLQAQQEAFEILYPAYGTYAGSAISGGVPYGYFAGLVGGHLAGRWKSWRLQNSDEADQGSFVHRRTPAVSSFLR